MKRSNTRAAVPALLLACASLFALPAPAQQVDQAQMQEMMKRAQEMQECMGKIDQSAMLTLQQKGEEVSKSIDALCKAGKRDEAAREAIAYGKEMATSPQMGEMRKCGESMRSMMPAVAPTDADGTVGGTHVCDLQ